MKLCICFRETTLGHKQFISLTWGIKSKSRIIVKKVLYYKNIDRKAKSNFGLLLTEIFDKQIRDKSASKQNGSAAGYGPEVRQYTGWKV